MHTRSSIIKQNKSSTLLHPSSFTILLVKPKAVKLEKTKENNTEATIFCNFKVPNWVKLLIS